MNRFPYKTLTGLTVLGLLFFGLASVLPAAAQEGPDPDSRPLAGDMVTAVVSPIGHYSGTVTAFDVEGDYAYLGTPGSLVVLDVSDPYHPEVIASQALSKQDPLTPDPTSVQVYGGRAYVTTSFVYTTCCLGGYLDVFQVDRPTNPVKRGSLFSGGLTDAAIAGNQAYLTTALRLNPVDELVVANTQAADPVQIAEYSGAGGGSWGIDLMGSTAYIATSTGIKIVDVTQPLTPTLLGQYAKPAFDVQVAGELAYIAAGADGILIVDVSNPKRPSLKGQLDTPGNAYSVFVSGPLVFVADGESGMHVVDASVASSPHILASYDTPGWAMEVQAQGSLVFVADENGGLHLLLLEMPVTTLIPTSGGSFGAPQEGISYTFLTDTFNGEVWVTHKASLRPGPLPANLISTGRFFNISAVYSGLPTAAEPTQPYILQYSFADQVADPALVDNLALYFWDGSQWLKEPSELDLEKALLTATPDRFGVWALAAEADQIYLPLLR